MRPTLKFMEYKTRRWLQLGWLAQAGACLAGAVCLYVAIDDWLTGYPFRSAVFTVLAFWNGYNFIKSREVYSSCRKLLREIRELKK